MDKSSLITVTYYTSSSQEHIIFSATHKWNHNQSQKSHKDLKGSWKICPDQFSPVRAVIYNTWISHKLNKVLAKTILRSLVLQSVITYIFHDKNLEELLC